jgi:hypothetical protein
VDLDTGIADRPDGNRQGDALQERKVHMDVEPRGLETSEPADDRLELTTNLVEIVQALFETEVIEVVGAKFVAQEY